MAKKLASKTLSKVSITGISKLKEVLTLKKVKSVLAIIFYIIWIPVGIFFLWFIVANFKLGAFDQLMGVQRAPTVQTDQGEIAETEIPGVGKVNVACVQETLSEESIMTIVNESSDASLSEEEKGKLKTCLVGEASPSPIE